MSKQNKKTHFSVIVILVILLVNYLLTLMPLGEIYESYFKNPIFNIVKICAYAYIGWLMVYFYDKSLGIAAISGAVVYFFDHVILRFIYFSIIFWDIETVVASDFQKSLDVLLKSYLFFVPVVLLVSLVGGYFARRRKGKITVGKA